jgi:hypothetical protein
MRKAFLAFVTSTILFVRGINPAGAEDYRYCIQGDEYGAGECSFSTYQQCQATASGLTAYCGTNRYLAAHVQPIVRNRLRHPAI